MRRFRCCPEIALGPGLRAVVTARPVARLLGLALVRRSPARALLIPHCRSVHTWGMRFPIDVVFVAPGPAGLEVLEVLAVHAAVPPWRIVSHRGGPRGVAALELAAQSTRGATAAGAGRTNTRWPTSYSSTEGSWTSTVLPASWRRR